MLPCGGFSLLWYKWNSGRSQVLSGLCANIIKASAPTTFISWLLVTFFSIKDLLQEMDSEFTKD